MSCPKFVDFTRECIGEIKFIPVNTIDYCETDKHKECPFYLILSGKRDICKNINKCPAFKNFSLEDFQKFVAVTKEYCTSGNHKTCQRYILKEKGEIVPVSLHPDGHTMEKLSK